MQSKSIIDAAAGVAGLERFVLSSLPGVTALSGGKYSKVYQFDSKSIAEGYCRENHPALWKKTSIFYAPFHLENYSGQLGAVFRPKLDRATGSLTLAIAEPLASAPLPWFSAAQDTGPLVSGLLQAAPGAKLMGVREVLSTRRLAQLFAQALNKTVSFVDPVQDDSAANDPDLAQGFVDLIGWCIEFGYDVGKVDGSVVSPEELGFSLGGTAKEWFESQSWEGVLQSD